ncbi:hypothetical protein ACTFIU_009474 [Dictyostelium citrinum]
MKYTAFFFILFISIVCSLIDSEYSCVYKLSKDCGNLKDYEYDATKDLYNFCYFPPYIQCNADNVTKINWQFTCSNSSFILTSTYFDCFQQLGYLSVSRLNISSDFIYNKIKNVNEINFDQANIASITNYIPSYQKFSINSNRFLVDNAQLKYLQNVEFFYSTTSLINFSNDGTIPQNKSLKEFSTKTNKFPDLTGYDSIKILTIIIPETVDTSSFSNLKSYSKLSTLRIISNSFCSDFIYDINQLSSTTLTSLYIIGCIKPLTRFYSLKNISTVVNFDISIDGSLYYLLMNNERFFPFDEIQPVQQLSMKGGNFKMYSIGRTFENVSSVILSNNNVVATFEPKFGDLPFALDISNNFISGELDSSWCSTSLIIRNNNFTGDIPSCFYCYFDDLNLKDTIVTGNQFNQVKTACTTIIPNLKVSNNNVIVYGTDLPLAINQFRSIPSLDWNIRIRSKEFGINSNLIPASTKTIDFLILNGKYNFTLALDQNQPPIISNIKFTTSNSVLISGSYFTYDISSISFLVDYQPCSVSSSSFYEIQCSLGPSFVNGAKLVLSYLKIGDRPSEQILIDTSVSFNNIYCSNNCSGIGLGICNMRENICVKCPSDCSNHGICNIFTNKCTCNNGFVGDDCSGIACNPSDCNGNGICDTSIGKCNCNIDWASSDCNTTNHYVSSIISTSTSGGLVTLLGMFGDTHNNPSIKIGDLNCLPLFTINSKMIQCEIGAGVGYKSVQVTQNGITWIGNEQFKYYDTILSCPSQCSSHGICNTSTGNCKCNSNWSGIDCAIEIKLDSPPSNSTIDTDTGNSVLKNGETKYSILITSINEIDFNGNSIKEISLENNWIFDSNKSNENFYYFIQYLNNSNNNNINNNNNSNEINNDRTIIISTIEEVKQSKQFSFADINFNVESGSIKFTTTIKNWKYSSVLNTLELRMNTTVDQNDDCNDDDTNIAINNNNADKLNYMTISKNGKVLYGRFLEKVLSDSRPSYVQNRIIEKNENSILVGLNLPHCVDSCIVDPDFSVLVNSDFSSNCNNSNNNNRKKWLIPVAVVVPVVGLSILVMIFYVLYRKNSTLIKVHLLSKIKLKNMNPNK